MENGTIATVTAIGRGRIAPASAPNDPLARVTFTNVVFEADWAEAITGRAVQFDRLTGENVATRVVLMD